MGEPIAGGGSVGSISGRARGLRPLVTLLLDRISGRKRLTASTTTGTACPACQLGFSDRLLLATRRGGLGGRVLLHLDGLIHLLQGRIWDIWRECPVWIIRAVWRRGRCAWRLPLLAQIGQGRRNHLGRWRRGNEPRRRRAAGRTARLRRAAGGLGHWQHRDLRRSRRECGLSRHRMKTGVLPIADSRVRSLGRIHPACEEAGGCLQPRDDALPPDRARLRMGSQAHATASPSRMPRLPRSHNPDVLRSPARADDSSRPARRSAGTMPPSKIDFQPDPQTGGRPAPGTFASISVGSGPRRSSFTPRRCEMGQSPTRIGMPQPENEE